MSEQVLNRPTVGEEAKSPTSVSSSSSSSSPSNSISLIRLDELSSFGATKQSRLPTLIKLNTEENVQQSRQINSMPEFSAEQLEKSQPMANERQQVSLPAQLAGKPDEASSAKNDKENQSLQVTMSVDKQQQQQQQPPMNSVGEDFQMVDMASVEETNQFGPSLPQQQVEVEPESNVERQAGALGASQQANIQQQQQPSYLAGDSLIEMIVNLRSENQNLVRALETNNEYVKERLNEFKRFNEEAKRREAQFATEKADHEHQVRKLQRQNMVLSERLKSMEAKLKEMKLEVSDSLAAAHSSKASSLREDAPASNKLYPDLGEPNSFSGPNAGGDTITMQMDATSGELLDSCHVPSPTAPPMETDQTEAMKVAGMSDEQLKERFDAPNKNPQATTNAGETDFYALDDPMKQCDRLEQQLNDIGKRDYEICLLQQQLNIYRQDFRLERMANLEAKIQIEKLKNDIDKLCFERLQEKSRLVAGGQQPAPGPSTSAPNAAEPQNHLHRGSHHRLSGGVRFDAAAAAADSVINKLGHHLGRKAARTAAKAAKYASKQAYREEKAAAAAAAALAASASLSGHNNSTNMSQQSDSNDPTSQAHQYSSHHHRRGHHHHLNQHLHGHHHRGSRGIRSEVVTDLLSTANKAMLTGYKMASTHVNLALDKLSAFEQAQAANLAQNKPQTNINAAAAAAAAATDKVAGNSKASGNLPSLD